MLQEFVSVIENLDSESTIEAIDCCERVVDMAESFGFSYKTENGYHTLTRDDNEICTSDDRDRLIEVSTQYVAAYQLGTPDDNLHLSLSIYYIWYYGFSRHVLHSYMNGTPVNNLVSNILWFVDAGYIDDEGHPTMKVNISLSSDSDEG